MKGEMHMKVISAVFALLAVTLLAGGVLAVPPGKTIEWENPAGKVVFDGKIHAEKGLKCNDCHTKIFKMKKGSDVMKMADINAGKFCGACHNGTEAFKANDPVQCSACHKK